MSPRGFKTLLFVLTIAGSLAKALAYEVEAGSNGKDCVCGLPNPGAEEKAPRSLAADARVIGGVPLAKNELPWLAGLALWWKSTPDCGAALISDRWLLTAAHCIPGSEVHPKYYHVLLSEHDLTSEDGEVRAKPRLVFRHPKFEENAPLDYDFALVELTKPVEFSDTMRPVALPSSEDETFEGAEAIVAGWGRTTANFSDCSAKHSDVPLKASVTVTHDCKDSPHNPEEITDNMVCAYAQGRDSCLGDSGGPLVTLDPETGRYVLIGVTSWGEACATDGFPGVYSRVTKALDWIEQVTGYSLPCGCEP